MATYFQDFAFEVPFPEQAALDLEKFIDYFDQEKTDLQELPAWFLKDFTLQDGKINSEAIAEYFENLEIEYIGVSCSYFQQKNTLYVSNEDIESPNIDGFVQLLSMTMKEYNIQEPIAFSVAQYCSRKEPGSFGCATYAVGPGIIKGIHSNAFEDRLKNEVMNELGHDNNEQAEMTA